MTHPHTAQRYKQPHPLTPGGLRPGTGPGQVPGPGQDQDWDQDQAVWIRSDGPGPLLDQNWDHGPPHDAMAWSSLGPNTRPGSRSNNQRYKSLLQITLL